MNETIEKTEAESEVTETRDLVSEERALIERMKVRAKKRKLGMPPLLAIY